jgi:hypothetical protein
LDPSDDVDRALAKDVIHRVTKRVTESGADVEMVSMELETILMILTVG